MKLDLTTGIVNTAHYISSPNHDERENGEQPEVLIIHCISLPPGCYGGNEVEDFFCNRLDIEQHEYFNEIQHLTVSAHFYIRRNGQLLQFVPTHKRAWHAGESECLGRCKVNNFSIGIELEGLDTDPEGFTNAQYDQLLKLSHILIEAYPLLKVKHIFGHEDIAPGRKTDPGPYFDWDGFLSKLV